MSIEKSLTERNAWLDWCRAFAIAAVVLIHSVEQLIPIQKTWLPETSEMSRCLILLAFTVGRLGVPVFLFLTGYLIPGRYEVSTSTDYWSFLKKKWLPLFVCTEIWAVISAFFLVLFISGYGVRTFLDLIFLNAKAPLSHWWYLPVILGFYLFLPFLSFIWRCFGRHAILLLFGISLFAHVVRPLLYLVSINVAAFDLSFIGDFYLTFILCGFTTYLYKDVCARVFRFSSIQLLALCLFAFNLSACTYSQIHEHRFIWYSWPPLITAGLLAPFAFIGLQKARLGMITVVSISSFGIYLIHNLILKATWPWLHLMKNEMLRVGVAWTISFGLSLLIVQLLSRYSRPVGRALFLIK